MNRYNALRRQKNKLNYAKRNVLASIVPKLKRPPFWKFAKKKKQKKIKMFVKTTLKQSFKQ